ncbi:DUF2807 domain-containing protein, partial [Roseibium sp. RKSG952]|uniref:GIN domain-containing protein n=1 Tax=Roseibium sp. RKSG952 TaxID=2529384 RepID=UPI0012BD77B9
MKRLFAFSLVTLIFISLASNQLFASDVTVTKDIKDYKSILLDAPAHVFIREGNKYSLKIEMSKNIVPYVNVNNQNGTLTLGLKPGYHKNYELSFYITSKYVDSLTNAGPGVVEVTSDLQTKTMHISNDSSGSITAKNISASGGIKIIAKSSGHINIGDINSSSIAISGGQASNILIN